MNNHELNHEARKIVEAELLRRGAAPVTPRGTGQASDTGRRAHRPGHGSPRGTDGPSCWPPLMPATRSDSSETFRGRIRQPEVWINPPENRPTVRTIELPRDTKLVPQLSQSH